MHVEKLPLGNTRRLKKEVSTWTVFVPFTLAENLVGIRLHGGNCWEQVFSALGNQKGLYGTLLCTQRLAEEIGTRYCSFGVARLEAPDKPRTQPETQEDTGTLFN